MVKKVVEVEEIEIIEVEEEEPSSVLEEQEPKKKEEKKALSIKTASIIAVVLILLTLGFYYKSLLVAATVDGSPISRLAVLQELEKTSGKSVLDSLVIQKLIDNEANAKDITVSEEDVAAEMQKIEEGLKAQGATLDQALEAQQMTREDLVKQLTTRTKLEKLVGDKLAVTDEDVAAFIEENKVEIPEGQEEGYDAQIREQIKQQKFSTAAQELIDSLKKDAKVNYFVTY